MGIEIRPRRMAIWFLVVRPTPVQCVGEGILDSLAMPFRIIQYFSVTSFPSTWQPLASFIACVGSSFRQVMVVMEYHHSSVFAAHYQRQEGFVHKSIDQTTHTVVKTKL
jgi:hypothetical protein